MIDRAVDGRSSAGIFWWWAGRLDAVGGIVVVVGVDVVDLLYFFGVHLAGCGARLLLV